MTFKVKLGSIEDVKNFVRKCSEIPEEIPVRSGRYTVQGNSIMGIFSLDLTQPVEVTVPDEFTESFSEYINV